MTAETELRSIAAQMAVEFAKAFQQKWPLAWQHGNLKRLALEANAILTSHLGPGNSFSLELWPACKSAESGYLGRTLENVMSEAHQIILGAANHIAREPLIGPARQPSKPLYIDEGRIAELSRLSHPRMDFSRLVQMCRELNTAYESECYISVALLLRAIIDHVPPVFGEANFTAAANKLPQSKKKSALNLQNSSRNIGDSYLHQHIRKKEVLPTMAEVNFSQDLSVVLGEVISAATVDQSQAASLHKPA